MTKKHTSEIIEILAGYIDKIPTTARDEERVVLELTVGVIRRAERALSEECEKCVLVKPTLQKCMDIIDDDLEERPARHSLGMLYKEVQNILGE